MYSFWNWKNLKYPRYNITLFDQSQSEPAIDWLTESISSYCPNMKPLVWEYAWCCSLPFVFYGLSSLRRNIIRSMSVFVMGNVVFALLPVLFSLGYYLSDFWQYVSSRSSDGLMLWQVSNNLEGMTTSPLF